MRPFFIFSVFVLLYTVRSQGNEDHRIELQRGHFFPVRHLAFSSDGERLFTASSRGVVKVWDSNEGTLLATLYHRGGLPSDLALSKNDTLVAISQPYEGITVWNWEENEILLEFGEGGHSLDFENNEKLLFCSGGELKRLDLNSGQVKGVISFEEGVFEGSATAGGLYSTHSISGASQLWDLSDGQKLDEIPPPPEFDSPAMHTWVDWKSGQRLYLMSYRMHQTRSTVEGLVSHRDFPIGLYQKLGQPNRFVFAVSKNGRELFLPEGQNQIGNWSVETGGFFGEAGPVGPPIAAMAFSTDEDALAVAREESWELLNFSRSGIRGSVLSQNEGVSGRDGLDTGTVAVSTDQNRMAIANLDRTLRLLDFSEGIGSSNGAGGGVLENLKFVGSSELMAAEGSKVKTWDATTGELVTDHDLGSTVLFLQPQNDQRIVVSRAGRGANYWDRTEDRPHTTGVDAPIGFPYFCSKDGVSVSIDDSRNLNVLELPGRKILVRVRLPEEIWVNSFFASKALGKLLIFDRSGSIWSLDLKESAVIEKFLDSSDEAKRNHFVLSSDSRFLAHSINTDEVGVFDMKSRALVFRSRGSTQAPFHFALPISFGPTSKTLWVSGMDQRPTLWCLDESRPLLTVNLWKDGACVVSDHQGRFDANRLGHRYVSWISRGQKVIEEDSNLRKASFTPGLYGKVIGEVNADH